MSSISTISFFKYQDFWNKLWAFGMMQFAHQHLTGVKGQRFYKLMGSGKGIGFNPLPDWSVYCLLQVWDKERFANDFIANSKLFKLYRDRAENVCTLYLKNIISKGAWAGGNPFEPSTTLSQEDTRLAIITRATIRPSKLLKFWSYVPTSQKALEQQPGLIYKKGVGEAPIIQMATFSIWKNEEALNQFVYKDDHHAKAIRMTRELDWYKEELFARFQIFKIVGKPIW